MKKEALDEGFGALNDDVLKRSEKEEGTMKKRNMSKILKIGSLAACLIVALGVGVFFIGGNKTPSVEVWLLVMSLSIFPTKTNSSITTNYCRKS